MPALSTYVENMFVDALLRNQTFTNPTSWYLALYLTNPTAADSGTEISGGAYVRQPIIFGPPSGGALANSAQVDFPMASANWGNVAYAAIRDASTAGNLLVYGSMVTPRYVTAGDVLKFLIGSVVITVS